jgi:rRNA maturation endonuclease Nob1
MTPIMGILYLVGSTIVVAFILLGLMVLLTPRKGFEILGPATSVKCNRCGYILVQRESTTCPVCGNREVKVK